MTVLDTLARNAKERAEACKRKIPFLAMRTMAEGCILPGDPFLKALSGPGLSIIAEVKKASPSKGIIDPAFDYLSIAEEYDEGGADCISCLTEPTMFLGNDSYLEMISKAVAIPVLRKDFSVDPYMIYQARVLGASAVLLIASLLSASELKEFGEIAQSLGLSALYEAHDEAEIGKAIDAGAEIIGINSRNLRTFCVDRELSASLISYVPESITAVSESGIMTAEDAMQAYDAGYDAILVGESLMRASDRKAMLKAMKYGKDKDLRDKE